MKRVSQKLVSAPSTRIKVSAASVLLTNLFSRLEDHESGKTFPFPSPRKTIIPPGEPPLGKFANDASQNVSNLASHL